MVPYYGKTNDSNTHGSFTVADSNSFLSPREILPIDVNEENIIRHILNFLILS